jgi:hypothetical protein
LEGLELAGSTNLLCAWARVDTRRYSLLVSRDPIQGGDRSVPDYRWHISMAGEDDVPRWRDLVAVAHEVRPGVCFVVGIPPKSHWMSVHPHCLHLWEVSDDNLTDQWMSERMGVEPS